MNDKKIGEKTEMKLYNVTLTAIAEREVFLLANSAQEAERKALDIYLNTDLLDIEPYSMAISDVHADEVTTLARDEVCERKCKDCPIDIRVVCAFGESRARNSRDT